MDEGSRGSGGGGHGGSVREWRDLSTWLSASAAAAGLMLAGEGNGGADKVWAPTESMEPPALHQSLEGGEDSEWDERNDYVRKAGNDEKVEGQRFGGKLCTKTFFFVAATGLSVVTL